MRAQSAAERVGDDDSSQLAQRIIGLSRNQTGANLLSHLASNPVLAPALIGASSPVPVANELLDEVAAVSSSARRSANWSKLVGVVFMTLALALLCCAIFWPAIEKHYLKIPESIFTGVSQAVLTLFGGYLGSLYLRAKKRQTALEDGLRRLVFEHGHPRARIEKLRMLLGKERREAYGNRSRIPLTLDRQNVPEIVTRLRSTSAQPLNEAQALAFVAQLKEITIKRYALGLAAVMATIVSAVSIALAIVLPFATAFLPKLLESEVADTLQPMLGVALPVFFLALRKEARSKCQALDETVASILNDSEPPSAKAQRAIAAVTSIDGGMATFAEQSPALGATRRYE